MAFGGMWPTCDLEGRPVTNSKANRLAGTPMADKWAVVEYRGDWKLGPIEQCW